MNKVWDLFGMDSQAEEEYDEDEVEDENGIDVVELKTFYYEGVTCGKSEIFDTPEEAYNEACEYLDNIELYVDLE